MTNTLVDAVHITHIMLVLSWHVTWEY